MCTSGASAQGSVKKQLESRSGFRFLTGFNEYGSETLLSAKTEKDLCSGDHVEQARPPGLLGQQPPRPPRLGGHYRLWGWPPLGLWCLSVGAAGGGSTAPPPLLCSHRGRTGLLLLPRPIVPDIKPPFIGTAIRIGFNWSFLKYNDVSGLHWFYAHPDSALYLDADPDWYIIHGFRNEGQTCK